ncbi:Acetylxylan esteraser [Fimbriiglobus ruber]|uniref:Acetylxylan esteraser n=1 Tax=Fimbriiglobus ruber TaxID=1908690 RepID=A0A225DWD7_9BACT|nr:Acetylxylan esteraser [Fimbriiglobus ruber]
MLALLALGQPGAPEPLWPGKAPLAVGDSPTDRPELTPFLVPAEKANGAAVVVLPGGGYGGLAADHEGKQVAEFFNKLGVQAFVLKYRIATKDRPGPLLQAPLLDAQRAVRTVRAHAQKYGIDPKRVGVIGFSAGGHLASTIGTHFDDGLKDGDEIDKQSCRPDWLVLAYPVVTMEDGVTHGGSKRNLLGDKPDAKLVEEFSNEKQVTAKTPPTFIFQTDEDTAVPAENATRFYLALKKAKVPAEFHVYAKGRHGVGLGSDPRWTGGDTYSATWPDHLAAWLKVRGILTQK